MRTWRIPTDLGYDRAPYPTGSVGEHLHGDFYAFRLLGTVNGPGGGGFARLEIAKLGPGTPFVVTPDPVP